MTAGRLLRSCWLAMAEMGETPLSLLLQGEAGALPNRHYPSGDVYDVGHHTQFYCHIHRAGETGHIHLFQRARGMPAGLRPMHPSDEDNAPCHLVAVGLGPDGNAAALFTTNRWVTGEDWYAAPAVKAMLSGFGIQTGGRLAPVAAWLEALVAFYRPAIEHLIDRRDAAVAAWSLRHPAGDPLTDGNLEVTSRLAIDPAADLAAVGACPQ
ncbi:MAG: hypothetical protein EPN20_17150 [Magnetospirillum sp.]|nr:MAG: hypothetical protein EPN20_17150 [Magnetospirillum sp.]